MSVGARDLNVSFRLCFSCFLLFAVVQEGWCKSMFAVAEYINQCGAGALNGLAAMEAVGRVTGYLFKPMVSLCVPEDWQRVTAMMEVPDVKPTAMRLRECTKKVTMERWWTWVLLHPDLTISDIHPTRSMFLFLLSGWLAAFLWLE